MFCLKTCMKASYSLLPSSPRIILSMIMYCQKFMSGPSQCSFISWWSHFLSQTFNTNSVLGGPFWAAKTKEMSIHKQKGLDRMITLVSCSSTYCSLIWPLIWNIIEKFKGSLIMFTKSLRWGVFLAGLKKPMPHEMCYLWPPVSLCLPLLWRSSFSCSMWPKITPGSHVPGRSHAWKGT